MHKKVLERIERGGEEFWIVGPEAGRMLWWLVRVLQPEVALEIGTSVGYSAIWIGSALEGGRLWTVESHAERFEMAKANILEAGVGDKVLQVKGHAPEVLGEVPDEIDFAFFDATKNEHGQYFDAVLPKMRKGGVIVVDNVISHREEMGRFLNRMKRELECVEIDVGKGFLLGKA
jgi:predicted O-methyltransferase YrrM